MSTDDQVDKFKQDIEERIAKRALEIQEELRAKRQRDAAHIKAAIAAKIDPNLNADDATKAKSYSRARAFMMLRQSYDVLEEALHDPLCKQATKISVALTNIQRAVGFPAPPNAVSVNVNEMAPVDIIDLLLQEHANGNITKEYIASMLGLLAAKVQGLKIEDLMRKVKEKKADALPDTGSAKGN